MNRRRGLSNDPGCRIGNRVIFARFHMNICSFVIDKV